MTCGIVTYSPPAGVTTLTMDTPPQIRELDFSRFHPIDHWPWGCWRRNARQPIYGRTWTHVRYAWEWKWRRQLRAATTCRLGRHLYRAGWQRSPGGDWAPAAVRCLWCMKKDEP